MKVPGASPAPRRLAALVAAVWAVGAQAQEFVVRDIRVEGIQRTEAGTVFGYLPLRVGDRYDPERGAAAIRALYATGLFKDVRLEVDGDVLVVAVDERPAIAALTINGVKEFEKDAVARSLREVGLAEGRILDRSLLERAEQELKRQYLGRGRYAVTVQTTVTPIERNRVNVTINVDEGEAAVIRSIAFTGNKAFSQNELLRQMELTTPGWLTWYTKRDQYSRQKLQADLETLRSFYLNRGFLEFNIESTQVSIDPEKESIHITINVSEGERFTVSGVKLAGETLGLDEELRALIDVKPGETFSAERMNAISKRITDRLSALGYAFATANPVPEPNRDKREVAFTIVVDPGRRVYVRRVNITGNTRTREDVIRRQMRQYEGGWFDAEKVRLSRNRIDRLGFFEKVEVETPAVPGSLDQVDVNVDVKERSTGSIQAGAGYNSTEGIVLTASFSQQNAFGSGQAFSLAVNTSKALRTFRISHTDPYATIDGISRTVDLYYSRSDLASLNLGNVDYDTAGASMRFGVPFTEVDTVYFGVGYEATKIGIIPCDPLQPLLNCSPSQFTNYVNLFGTDPDALLLTVGWARDSRDNLLAPTSGIYQILEGQVGIPPLDLQYYRASYQYQQYVPLPLNFALSFNGYVGVGGGYNDEAFPPFKNFYVGGIGSVRGYEAGSLGPVSAQGTYLGGTRRLNGTIQLISPLPGADRTLRGFLFVDGGWVWGADQPVNLGDLRYSTGIGLAWISPVGPLQLSYAYPINTLPTDALQRFQFQIGTGF